MRPPRVLTSVSDSDESFAALAASRSWDWLLVLRRRLLVDVQLVDERHESLLPASGGADPSFMPGATAETRAVLSEALRTGTPQVVATGPVHLVYVPLQMPHASAARGALIVARYAGDDERPSADTSARLELLGRWIGSAAEAHLHAGSAGRTGPLRTVPLWRLLTQSAEKHDRDLVAACAEALAVWHDLDVRGYVETVPGVWVLTVSLGGTTAANEPLVLPRDLLPGPLELRPLPAVAGRDEDATALVTTLRPASDRAWLIVVAGDTARCDRDRLGSYLALLDTAVALATEEAARRMLHALTHRLVTGDDSPEAAISQILEDVRTALGSASVRLTVEVPVGTPRCRIEIGDLARPADRVEQATLHAERREGSRCETTLTLRRANGDLFTPQDHFIAETAVSLLHGRVGRALRAIKAPSATV